MPLVVLFSTWVGWRLRASLPDHHRERDTVDAVRVMMTLLATFAAVVLGLLTTSAKAHYDLHAANLDTYGIDLIQLDQRMREYGPAADPVRTVLRAYTAAAIADTWPDEPRPSGTYPTDIVAAAPGSQEGVTLGAMLLDVDSMVARLVARTPVQHELLPAIRTLMLATLSMRWHLIESARPTISWPFLLIMVAWLVLLFAIFGLSAPVNGLTHLVIVLCAISLALSFYLTLELDTPVSGLMRVPSTALREALAHMDKPQPPPDLPPPPE